MRSLALPMAVLVAGCGGRVVAGSLGGPIGSCPADTPDGAENCRTPSDGGASVMCLGDPRWSRSFSASITQNGVAIDRSGNVLLAGETIDPVDFGGGLLPVHSVDIFLVKLDPDGNHVWSKTFGSPDEVQRGRSVAVDQAGNVFLSGALSGTVDFGGGPLTSAFGSDLFIAKFDASGHHLWSTRFSDDAYQSTSDRKSTPLAVDAAGNVILVSEFTGRLNLGGETLDPGAWSMGDFFVAKLDPNGQHLWQRHMRGIYPQRPFSVATDCAGNVLLCGLVLGEAELGGATLHGGTDVAIAKLDPSGEHLWSKLIGSGNYVTCAMARSGHALLSAYYDGTIDFGVGAEQADGLVVAQLDREGTLVWKIDAGGDMSAARATVALDRWDNVLVAGEFGGTMDFGGGPLGGTFTDTFLAKLDPSGLHLWSKRFGSVQPTEVIHGVGADGSGRVFLAGSTSGTMDLGGGVAPAGEGVLGEADFVVGFTP